MVKHKVTGRIPPNYQNAGKPWLGKTPGVETYTPEGKRIRWEREKAEREAKKVV